MRSGSSYLIKFAILFTLVMLLVSVMQLSSFKGSTPEKLAGVLRPMYKPLSDIALTDHDGNTFSIDRFNNKWTFVFFGYTSCPDICPATLSVLNTVIKKIETQQPGLSDDTQVVFVSVDPARDSPEKLLTYINYFNEDFIGVTGDKAGIDNLAKQFSAGYSMEPETAPGEYLVNHTSAIFLVGPEARLVATFSQPHQAETIASLFGEIYKHIRSN